MSEGNFFSELKRRNVYKVAVAYAVVGWLAVQVATQVFPFLEIPNWVIRLVIAVVTIGFPIALVIAWAFEATPEGIKPTEAADAMPGAAKPKRHAWIYVVVLGVAFSMGLFFIGRYTARDTAGAARTELPEKSIAVLPFENLSEDKSNAFFAEGVQDEILTRLAKVADLKVISRTSTQRFKSVPANLPDIAKQLGVMHILEGSVQKANDQVRVNVQLINAMTDAHLWADTYDRKLIDIFSVESEIAKTIADTLQAKLTGSEMKMMTMTPTENPEAYQLYLQGRFFWNKRTAADLRKSIDCFNQAIAKDPNYALAYAGLAQTWTILSAHNGGAPVDCYPQADAAARKALSLDNTLSDACAALASTKENYNFDFPGAMQEYERAIQLNPNDATPHHWFGAGVLAATGQQARELAELKRALELDPLSLIIRTNLGVACLHHGRIDEAIAHFRKAIELDGTFHYAQRSYGLALELQGKIPEAISYYEKAASLTDAPIELGMLGRIYGIVGRKDEARKILERLRQSRAQRYTAAYSLALVAVGLGDKAEAVHWLEEGYRDRDGDAIGVIRVDPALASLHGDPRFEALAEKIVPMREFGKALTQK
jgi:TolB-like protein/tetratricopeptide (TPR) repeat protein